MTRDEAIRKFQEFEARPSAELAEDVVDFLAWGGLLKLDKPKTVLEKIFEVLMKSGCCSPSAVMCELERAGLQITEEENGHN